jgi:Protein of unknown function (DUF2812).
MEVYEMGSTIKYKPSMGLAFNENNEMNMLSEMARKGWIFYSYKFLGYRFIKSEPKDLIYCVDMHNINKDEKDHYFSIFGAAGWSHVCSVGNFFHYFSAVSGTEPIYTDTDTLSEKYKMGTRYVFKSLVVIVPILAGSILFKWTLGKHSTSILGLIASMAIGSSIGLLFAFIITGIILKIKAKNIMIG